MERVQYRQVSSERKVAVWEFHEIAKSLSDEGFSKLIEYAMELILIESSQRTKETPKVLSLVRVAKIVT
jgi:hypothetical protein